MHCRYCQTPTPGVRAEIIILFIKQFIPSPQILTDILQIFGAEGTSSPDERTILGLEHEPNSAILISGGEGHDNEDVSLTIQANNAIVISDDDDGEDSATVTHGTNYHQVAHALSDSDVEMEDTTFVSFTAFSEVGYTKSGDNSPMSDVKENKETTLAGNLQNQVLDFLRYIQSKKYEIFIRHYLVHKVQHSLVSKWEGIQVNVFGCLTINTFLPDSNIDMVVTFPNSLRSVSFWISNGTIDLDQNLGNLLLEFYHYYGAEFELAKAGFCITGGGATINKGIYRGRNAQ
ncbi:hypothetical protein BCR42DRAFT_437774 [Absidia repens]|uniref:Polynucleotide adenylyltransferase n=1 Tax=Absidia repens TaxID=90262 RepID=A0A1X2IHH2_9FUNG|nr:hypothetical protein BCR42DRAFT_437774 [Absidia repens]